MCEITTSEIIASISAIATAVMAIFTYSTIRQNKKRWEQEDVRREEDERARLVFSIFMHNNFYQLKILNIGRRPVYDIVLSIESRIPTLFETYPVIATYFEAQDIGNIHLSANQYTLLPLAPIDIADFKRNTVDINRIIKSHGDEEINKKIGQEILTFPIIIKGTYNNRLYEISQTIVIKEFIRNPIIDE